MMNLCRICLKEGNTSIFQESEKDNLFMKITTCLPIKISQDDKLPNKICWSCNYYVNLFYDFWVMSLKSEENLRNILNNGELQYVLENDTVLAVDEIDSVFNPLLEMVEEVDVNICDIPEDSTEYDNVVIEEIIELNDGDSYVDLYSQEPTNTDDDRIEINERVSILNKNNDSILSNEKLVSVESTDEAVNSHQDVSSDSFVKLDVIGQFIAESHANDHLEERTKSNSTICNKTLDYMKKIDLNAPVIYECELCNQKFRTKYTLKMHLLSHNKDNCDQEFNTTIDMQTREINHSGYQPFQCDVCGNKYTRKPYLIQHKKLVHDNPYSFKCNYCGRRFSMKSTLKNHVKRHTGENKIHMCDSCGKTVSSRMALINHLRIHMGDKRYSCPVCGKSYVTKLQVERHFYIHTDTKPMTCTVCYKKFSTNSNLSKHVETHLKFRIVHRCSSCNKKYYSKYKLAAHIAKLHT